MNTYSLLKAPLREGDEPKTELIQANGYQRTPDGFIDFYCTEAHHLEATNTVLIRSIKSNLVLDICLQTD